MAELERIAQSQNQEPQYKEVIARLEKRVKEYDRTASKMYESNRSAIQDRTQFEAKARKAESALESAVEAAKRSDEKHQKKIEELEAAVARLTNRSGTSSAVGETETLLQEAHDKVQLLEKRLETSHKNEEYARQLYQDTSSSATTMRAEINELKAQNEELKKVSSSNLKDIHEIQVKNNADAYVREIAGLKTRVKDRETELDRVRDELRQLKNGRRETRQASVPRSPRMGLMSPRPPRGSGIGGPVSRGASPGPAPGSGLDVATSAGQQTGNGRWSYLRE
jgi:chromosome segregation ATPase